VVAPLRSERTGPSTHREPSGPMNRGLPRRRALIVTRGQDPREGGVERFSNALATALEQDGWLVDFACSGYRMSRWAYRLGLSYAIWSRTATRQVRHQPHLIVTVGFLGTRARATPRVHVFEGCVAGYSLALRGRVPLRVTLRSLVGGGAAEARAGRGARVVADSESTRDDVERFYRLRVDAVIPNGVDTDLFRPRPRGEARAAIGLPADARIAFYAGRLEAGKGSALLGPAIANAGYELVVAGPTAPDHGVHLGSLHHAELALAYNAADVVMLPTMYEGCSFVVLEALASRTPLLTTSVGWMRRFLDDVPQYRKLIIEPSVTDLTRGLRQLHHADLDELTAAGRAYVVENNDVRPWASSWIRLIDEVMAGDTTHQ
jgi:glycosyltransferase involved in cell wall biosynthesis